MNFDALFKVLNFIRQELAAIPDTLKLLVRLGQRKNPGSGIVGQVVEKKKPPKSAKTLEIRKIISTISSKVIVRESLFLIVIAFLLLFLWYKFMMMSDTPDLGSVSKVDSMTQLPDSVKAGNIKADQQPKAVSDNKKTFASSGFLPPKTSLSELEEIEKARKEQDSTAKNKPGEKPVHSNVTSESITGTNQVDLLNDISQFKKYSIVTAANKKQPYTIPDNTIMDTINPQFLLENPVTHDHQVSIIVSGLGINASVSDAIVDQLPENVTLVVSPYTPNVENFIEILKLQGFDVLMSLLLEDASTSVDLGHLTMRVKSTYQEKEQLLSKYVKLSMRCSGFYAEAGHKFLKSYPDVLECLEIISGYKKPVVVPPDILRNQFHKAAARALVNYAGVTLLGTGPEYESEFVALVKRTGYGILAFDINSENVPDKINQWIKVLSDNNISVVPISDLLQEPEHAIKSNKK